MKVKEILSDPRRRVIFVTIVTSIILLVLVVMLAVSIVSKKTKISTESTQNPITTPLEQNPAIADAKDKNPEPVDNSNNAGIVTVLPAEDTKKPVETPASAPSNNLPKTGPEDMLPLAAIAGASTAFVLSKKQQKAKAYAA